MSIVTRLEHLALTPEDELAALLREDAGSGAVVSFVGIVRPRAGSGEALSELVLEHHPILTQRSLDSIAEDAATRWEVTQIRIIHRCGTIPVGDPILFVGAAALHRRAAFDAADYLMDRLKTEAILWKREIGVSGSAWIEPTGLDYSDRKRWD